MPERDERPQTMDPKQFIVWNRLRILRDANKKVSEEADLLMQAIEAAPELDMSMQVAFGISGQAASVQQVRQPGT